MNKFIEKELVLDDDLDEVVGSTDLDLESNLGEVAGGAPSDVTPAVHGKTNNPSPKCSIIII